MCVLHRRERHDIPLIVETCVEEVERRGEKRTVGRSFILVHTPVDRFLHVCAACTVTCI